MQKSLEMTHFGRLFKKYRLHSEIETLSEFGDLLAEEGFIYETSLFTRWQKSERVPKERKVLLAILRVFIKRRGIQTIQQANTFIESANQRSLNIAESTDLLENLIPQTHTSLPAKPTLFIERDQIVEKAVWQMLNKENIYLYGMPGVGKTYLALYIAHSLKQVFSDGVFWFRSDVKSKQGIVDELLLGLGANPQEYGSIERKIERLSEILEDRHVLVILDNLNDTALETALILAKLPLKMLVTSIIKHEIPSIMYLQLKPFTTDEFRLLAREILGKPFFETNKDAIDTIGSLVGFLPISTVVSLKQVYANPHRIHEYISLIQSHGDNLLNIPYDDKNLFAAIDIAYKQLEPALQLVLISCSLFDGSDFSADLLARVLDQSKSEILKHLKQLITYSLLEQSTKKRFRLHPMVKEYSNTHLTTRQYSNLSHIYIRDLHKYKLGSDKYIQYFATEFDNIVGMLKRLYSIGEYKLVTELWSLISLYVFTSGNWEVMLEFDDSIRDSYMKIGDERGLAIYLIEDIGRIYFYQSNEVKLTNMFSEVNEIAEKLKDEVLKALINQKLGVINMFTDNLNIAEAYLLNSISILKNSELRIHEAKSHAYLGMVYAKKSSNKKAIQSLQTALKYITILDDSSVYGFIHSYLGHSFIKMNRLKSAEKHLKEALTMSRKYNVIIGAAMALEGLYTLYTMMGKNKILAQRYLDQANKYYSMLNVGKEKRFSGAISS